MAQAKIMVSNGDVRFELEGDQAFVESHLGKLLPMVRRGDGGSRPGKGGDGGDADAKVPTEKGSTGSTTRQTLKNFFKEKDPDNAYEAIAVVLQYKKQHEQTDQLSAPEIRAALLQAGYRPPEHMPQALTDGRRRYGYVQPAAQKGFWRLSHQGETLVEIDLPRSKAT